MRIALILPLLLLAACGSPQERCARKATSELQTVNRLITETESDLARGYTYVLEPVPFTFGVSYCSRRHDRIGFCGSHETQYRRRAVAIDGEAERRKLATLRQRQAALRDPTRAAVEACGVALVDP